MTGNGSVVATIAAGVAHDAAGNASLASDSMDNTVEYDITPPTVTINQAGSQTDPTNGSPINFTVVFSEAVTRLCHRRRDAQWHGRGNDRHRDHAVATTSLQRGGQRHDRQRHGDRDHRRGRGPRCGGQRKYGLHQPGQHRHLRYYSADGDDQPGRPGRRTRPMVRRSTSQWSSASR